MNIKCPNCSNELPYADLNEGWCDTCGKEIPLFAYHGAGLKGPERHVLSRVQVAVPAMVAETSERNDGPQVWQLAVIGVIVAAIAVAIVVSLA